MRKLLKHLGPNHESYHNQVWDKLTLNTTLGYRRLAEWSDACHLFLDGKEIWLLISIFPVAVFAVIG